MMPSPNSMIVVRIWSIHVSTLVTSYGQDKSVELSSSCRTLLIDHQPRPLHMRMNIHVFVGLKQIQIIEVPEKWGPDRRRCTVLLVLWLDSSATAFVPLIDPQLITPTQVNQLCTTHDCTCSSSLEAKVVKSVVYGMQLCKLVMTMATWE